LLALGVAIVVAVAAACNGASHPATPAPTATQVRPGTAVSAGLAKIRHIIVIMQENRSFDHYFGTFPGADGLTFDNGVPTQCIPDPAKGSCVAPYVTHADRNGGGPHGTGDARGDMNGTKMDGFIGQFERASATCTNVADPICSRGAVPDVMGYHTASDIPNYWAYAQHFVLQDPP
jgi:phospholipase C